MPDLVEKTNRIPGIENSLARKVDNYHQKGDLEDLFTTHNFKKVDDGNFRKGAIFFERVSEIPTFPSGEITYYALGVNYTNENGNKKSLMYFSNEKKLNSKFCIRFAFFY